MIKHSKNNEYTEINHRIRVDLALTFCKFSKEYEYLARKWLFGYKLVEKDVPNYTDSDRFCAKLDCYLIWLIFYPLASYHEVLLKKTVLNCFFSRTNYFNKDWNNFVNLQ